MDELILKVFRDGIYRGDHTLGKSREGISSPREAEHEEVDDESLDQFMAAADHFSNATHAVSFRRYGREKTAHKLLI